MKNLEVLYETDKYKIEGISVECTVKADDTSAIVGLDDNGLIRVVEDGCRWENGEKVIYRYGKEDQEKILKNLIKKWEELDRPLDFEPIENYNKHKFDYDTFNFYDFDYLRDTIVLSVRKYNNLLKKLNREKEQINRNDFLPRPNSKIIGDNDYKVKIYSDGLTNLIVNDGAYSWTIQDNFFNCKWNRLNEEFFKLKDFLKKLN